MRSERLSNPCGSWNVSEYFRATGYHCTNNEKEDYQFETPGTVWDESSKSADFRNRPDEDQPFFAVFNFMSTHESKIRGEPGHSDPTYVETHVLITLGSGSALLGYYVYHGGTNPEGRRTTLNEPQAIRVR